VLGRLLHEKRISDRELRDLHEDKLKSVRSLAKVLTAHARIPMLATFGSGCVSTLTAS
jgi:hypothetical protein